MQVNPNPRFGEKLSARGLDGQNILSQRGRNILSTDGMRIHVKISRAQ